MVREVGVECASRAKMRKRRGHVVALLLGSLLVLGQPPIESKAQSSPASAGTPKAAALAQENVTVTASKSRQMLDAFTKAFSAPTKLTGKIARWEKGICPIAVGQSPDFTAFVTARVKAVAAAAGAPVNASPSCTANIEIVFTTAPQELLDNVRKKNPDYLGYAESSAFRNELATVTRPIQAWYATETVDLNGMPRIDSARRRGGGITLPNFTAFQLPGHMGINRDPFYLPDATYARVTGNHINDGTRSGFTHIIITVDTKKLAGQDFVPLTDYVAMLALTHVNSLDTCQQLPSIVNKLAADCDQKVDGITATDLAYLHGIYQMQADTSLLLQQNEIGDRMQAALATGN